MSEKLICQWTVLGHETLDWAAKFSSENCQLSSPIPFIAFTPKIVPGTISCALPEINKEGDFFQLILLKTACSKLKYDIFIWTPPRSQGPITRPESINLLGLLPVYSPLYTPSSSFLSAADEMSLELLEIAGIRRPMLPCAEAAWIVRRKAIPAIWDMSHYLINLAAAEGLPVSMSTCLAFCAQMLTADRNRLS